MKLKKFLSGTLAFVVLFLSLSPEGIAIFQSQDPLNHQFNITIQDERGYPIDNVNIYIYSYFDQTVIATATTNFDGTCEVTYVPNFKIPSNGSSIYSDYIVYAEKNGYQDAMHYLTKIHSDSNDFCVNNNPNITIELERIDRNSASNDRQLMSTPSNYDKAVYNYCIETGKISDKSPIYVITESDRIDMAQRGIVKPATRAIVERFINVDIPVGEFHVDSHSYLDVTFSASDSLKVAVGTDTGVAGITINGSVTRTFGSETTYPQFSTTTSTARKKVYYTKGEFVVDETIIHSQGQIITTYKLDSIYGGTTTGATSQCTKCSKSFSAVENNTYGHYIPIDNGGTVTITQCQNRTNDLGLAVQLDGIDFDFGVTRITTGTTKFKYTPKANYNLRVYDYDSSFKTWHVTSSLAN